MKFLRLSILIVCLTSWTASSALGSTKDFKGLFGSYQRERFTENEARSTDLGVELDIGTLIPFGSVVNSTEDLTNNPNGNPMYSSTFFNVEGSFLLSVYYHWQFYFTLGHYGYDTRKENSSSLGNQSAYPIYHLFELEAVPMLLGVRYRMTLDDIVPYVGFGAGMSWMRRKGYYDNGAQSDEEKSYVVTAQIQAGVEFYFSPRAGLRLEASAFYFNANARTFNAGGLAADNPVMLYQAKIWSMRYSSGIFFLL